MIIREKYLSQIKQFYDKDLIKVITGIRRCGKSVILTQIMDELKDKGIKENQIIYINFESKRYDNIKNDNDLYYYIQEKMKEEIKYYLFLDEIQNIEEFQKAVDIYITGSNAFLLSGELATLLTGRYVEIKMLPLSFKEYVSAFSGNNNYQSLFLEYMKNGGMPGTISVLDLGINDINIWIVSFQQLFLKI